MAEKNERVFSWKQAKGNVFKVITNIKKGTLKVYNEKGKKIFERKNLSVKELKIVEENFLKIVSQMGNISKKSFNDDFDPMVA
jgi:hypothetical protein